jgi:hypothetical protein
MLFISYEPFGWDNFFSSSFFKFSIGTGIDNQGVLVPDSVRFLSFLFVLDRSGYLSGGFSSKLRKSELMGFKCMFENLKLNVKFVNAYQCRYVLFLLITVLKQVEKNPDPEPDT